MTTPDTDELNGIDKPYIPGDDIDIPGDISLHEETVDELDPVTYKVIQHRLWNINQQHGEIIENLAVSPITLETRDFQTGIQQANGSFVYFGQFLQYFAGVLDLNAKWLLEHRSETPGIEPGDMFLTNDPWICAPHQSDVTVSAPVFHEGELFCWVANVAHQNDVGGIVPGSFCQGAEDIFDDPTPIPPLKIVENGEIRDDIEHAYRRHSREPEQLGLDLRAQVAGNNHAREQITDLIETYGGDTVKTVMNQITERSEDTFSSILEDLPDGVWEERLYQEVARTDDRSVHEVRLRLEKDGDTLRFDNEGTDPQAGVINLPFAGWRGGILSALNLLLIPGEMGAVGGIDGHVELEPEIGTLTAPEYGAAVSAAGMYATHPGVSMAGSVISKMLLSSENEELREKAMSWFMAKAGMTVLAGVNQRDEPFIGPMMDGMIGAGSALPDRDGQFANGTAAAPEGQAPNAEFYERDWPILYLYRGEQPDSGGEGYRRGGNNGRVAYVQHGGDATPGSYVNEATPVVHGLFGGEPSSRVQSRIKRDTDVFDLFEDDALPSDIEDVDGDIEELPGKGSGVPLETDDVHEFTWEGAAGYGDPLDREPERVADDVAAGRISESTAVETYGVVIEDGAVDHDATFERRADIRHKRLRESTADRERADVESGSTALSQIRDRDERRIGDYLRLSGADVECAKCEQDLGRVDENTKESLAQRSIDIEEIGRHWIDTAKLHDDPMEFREFYCPNCASRLTTEIAKEGADLITDVTLRP